MELEELSTNVLALGLGALIQRLQAARAKVTVRVIRVAKRFFELEHAPTVLLAVLLVFCSALKRTIA